MTGARANATAVAVIRRRYLDFAERLPVLHPSMKPGASALSYTQWEACLALYHGKVLIIATPQDGAPRDARYALDEEQRAAQQAHLKRLQTVGRYPEISISNADRLAVDMLRSKLFDILYPDMQQVNNVTKRVAIAARELIVVASHVKQFSSTVVP